MKQYTQKPKGEKMLPVLLAGGMIAGSIASSIGNYQSMKEQNKIAKQNLDFQKQAYEDEKARTDKYEAERDSMIQANNELGNTLSANSQSPTMRV